MDEEDFLKKYNELRDKFSLPEYTDLDFNFEIGFPDDKNVLRAVRKKMSEKLEQYTKFIEELIQPDSSFSSMYDVKDFSDDFKKKVFSLFRRMMVFYKESIKLNMAISDEKDAEFVKDLYEFWLEVKNDVIVIIDKIKDTWEKDDDDKHITEYFG